MSRIPAPYHGVPDSKLIGDSQEKYMIAHFAMYTNSAKDCDGVATFSFEDSRNFGDAYQQISLFDRPLDALQAEMVKKYAGKQINVGALCNIVDCDFSNHYVGKNVKSVLKRLELNGQIEVVSGRKQKMRKGELNMPDGAVVRFL